MGEAMSLFFPGETDDRIPDFLMNSDIMFFRTLKFERKSPKLADRMYSFHIVFFS